jgi:Tol biopolymer transport system component
LPAPINSDAAEFFLSQSADGTIVFASDRPGGIGHFDLYYAEKTPNGAYRVTNFGPTLNTPGPEFDPCIAPDGRFIVFATARDGRRNLDLYISFRDEHGAWTAPTALRGGVNTDANEYAPTLSPDGRFLFFVRHDGKSSDVYWLATTQLKRS